MLHYYIITVFLNEKIISQSMPLQGISNNLGLKDKYYLKRKNKHISF